MIIFNKMFLLLLIKGKKIWESRNKWGYWFFQGTNVSKNWNKKYNQKVDDFRVVSLTKPGDSSWYQVVCDFVVIYLADEKLSFHVYRSIFSVINKMMFFFTFLLLKDLQATLNKSVTNKSFFLYKMHEYKKIGLV